MIVPFGVTTRALASVRTPPKVKQIAQVMGYAMYGGEFSGNAQFDFGTARPGALLPSRMCGSNFPGVTAALYSRTVAFSPSASTPNLPASSPMPFAVTGG